MEIYINKELNKIYQWLCANRLALNIKKINFVIFHPYNKHLKESITLKIHKKAIDEVPPCHGKKSHSAAYDTGYKKN